MSTLEYHAATHTLTLPERVTIADAAELLRLARDAEAEGADVRVDARGTTVIDTAGAQVLLALQQALATRGRALQWDGLTSAASQHLARGGLLAPLHAPSV